jgi:hypothetical protein
VLEHQSAGRRLRVEATPPLRAGVGGCSHGTDAGVVVVRRKTESGLGPFSTAGYPPQGAP